jgi:hypothetical protein
MGGWRIMCASQSTPAPSSIHAQTQGLRITFVLLPGIVLQDFNK